jgi:hypothetical protein
VDRGGRLRSVNKHFILPKKVVVRFSGGIATVEIENSRRGPWWSPSQGGVVRALCISRREVGVRLLPAACAMVIVTFFFRFRDLSASVYSSRVPRDERQPS